PAENTWQSVSSFRSKKPITDYLRRRAADKNPSDTTIPSVNKRKINARNKHHKTLTPVRYNTRSATR
ncbi:MAG: hypothetical protein RSC48_07055, partial [Anaerorhabdus sp.]